MCFSKIKRIESEILKLKEEFQNDIVLKCKVASENGVTEAVFENQKRSVEGSYLEKKEKLEMKRRFILDSRDSWLPKTVWNIIVPIVVSLITAYAYSKLGLK